MSADKQTFLDPSLNCDESKLSADLQADLAQLDALEQQSFAYRYAVNAISFAGETSDPPKGAQGRGEALATLDGKRLELLCSPSTAELLNRLQAAVEAGELGGWRAEQVRVIKRDLDANANIPADEQADFTRLVCESTDVWRRAKGQDDWDSFQPYLERILETMKRFAAYKNPRKDAYEVWLDDFEQGASTKMYNNFFAEVKETVIPLVKAVVESGNQPSNDCVKGVFDQDVQWKFARDLMVLEGLDMDALVIGATEHPFSESLTSQHVFVAGHTHEDDVANNLFSMLHEGGHAIYEQGVNPRFDYTSLAGGTSMGIHESQSRFFENHIGRSRAFAPLLLEALNKRFPEQMKGVNEEEFYLAVNRAEPSLVRTEADELTYPLHVLIRYELEQLLFSGEATVADIPELWAKKYKDYLGVEVPCHGKGALQDTHWASALIGYFPTYAFGSAIAAQLQDRMIEEGLAFNELVAKGDLAPIAGWLRDRIWTYGRSRTSEQLIQTACKTNFDPSHYTNYLKRKFTDIYKL